MLKSKISTTIQSILTLILVLLLNITANAKYSGGTGEPNNPYQIGNAEDLIALGNEPNDYDKHFTLIDDVNLAGYVFDKAVIAQDFNDASKLFEGTPFTGVFDGNSHTVSHLTILGGSYLGLFGRLDSGSEVKNLRVADVNIIASGDNIGAIAGFNHYKSSIMLCYCNGIIKSSKDTVGGLVGKNNFGTITDSYFQGYVSGKSYIGGLVGANAGTITNSNFNGEVLGIEFSIGGLVGGNVTPSGIIVDCNTLAVVSGNLQVGGFTGTNEFGSIIDCYALGSVTANERVGGFAGGNGGNITMCYASCDVSGNKHVGGFSGQNGITYSDIYFSGMINNCYSIGKVIGQVNVGGFVGYNFSFGGKIHYCYSTGVVLGTQNIGGLIGKNSYGGYNGEVINSFWDTQISDQNTSSGGTGKSTAEMKTKSTFTDAGWDFVGETVNGPNDIWSICEGTNYPRFVWQIPKGDFVCPDGITLEEDFDFFFNHWGNSNCDQSNGYCDGTDLDLSGIVDIYDFEIIINNWLKENL